MAKEAGHLPLAGKTDNRRPGKRRRISVQMQLRDIRNKGGLETAKNCCFNISPEQTLTKGTIATD